MSLTMGGNEDEGFQRMVEACPFGAGLLSMRKCGEVVQAAAAEIGGAGFVAEVRAVLEAVGGMRTARGVSGVNGASTMVVLVMGYPTLYNADTAIGKDCWMKKSRRAIINSLSTSINAVLKLAVEGMSVAGVKFLFVNPNEGGLWDGHRMCESRNRSWLQGLPDMRAYSIDDFYKGLFHPTVDGHCAMALVAFGALQKLG